ncbi:hypothetical protein A9Z40_03015 [Microbacterium arborescens]|uniref:Uncharacterized protein n=1 Tax=Microbacterium arborescens TaxID=33883 RepID=A0ABX2WI91_9MICO|nr:hypothetical protein [Microbacterium arborescens]OAZ40927.1 hypothetical protein A9Z40_03015 [Microbacterium arborescens]
MKLATGLVPDPKRWIVPTHTERVALQIGDGNLTTDNPLRHTGQQEVWVTTLSTPEDTREHPEGTPVAYLVTATAPRSSKMGVGFELLTSDPTHDDHDAYVRRQVGAPADALVRDHELHGFVNDVGLIRRELRWWVIEA